MTPKGYPAPFGRPTPRTQVATPHFDKKATTEIKDKAKDKDSDEVVSIGDIDDDEELALLQANIADTVIVTGELPSPLLQFPITSPVNYLSCNSQLDYYMDVWCQLAGASAGGRQQPLSSKARPHRECFPFPAHANTFCGSKGSWYPEFSKLEQASRQRGGLHSCAQPSCTLAQIPNRAHVLFSYALTSVCLAEIICTLLLRELGHCKTSRYLRRTHSPIGRLPRRGWRRRHRERLLTGVPCETSVATSWALAQKRRNAEWRAMRGNGGIKVSLGDFTQP